MLLGHSCAHELFTPSHTSDDTYQNLVSPTLTMSLSFSRRYWSTQRNLSLRSAIDELCYFLLTVGGVYEKAPRPPKPDFSVSSIPPSSVVAGQSATPSTSLTTCCQENSSHVTSQHMPLIRRTATSTSMVLQLHADMAVTATRRHMASKRRANRRHGDRQLTTTHEDNKESRMQSKSCHYCVASIKSRVSMDDPPINHHKNQSQTKGPSTTHQGKGPYRALARAYGDKSPQSIK